MNDMERNANMNADKWDEVNQLLLASRKGFSFDGVSGRADGMLVKGRASQGEFWGAVVGLCIPFCVIGLLQMMGIAVDGRASIVLSSVQLVLFFVQLVLLLRFVCCLCRRLHDFNMSGTIVFANVALIILAGFCSFNAFHNCEIWDSVYALQDCQRWDSAGFGWIVAFASWLWMGFIRGDKGANQYGPEPVFDGTKGRFFECSIPLFEAVDKDYEEGYEPTAEDFEFTEEERLTA